MCDPVMGDYGPGMYVPESLLPIYRERILPLADVCLPNQFEAELLTDRKISTESDALAAMRDLHAKGIRTVILSSAELAPSGDLVSSGEQFWHFLCSVIYLYVCSVKK